MSGADDGQDKDRDAIDRQRERWIGAVNAGDRRRYATLFAADGLWIPPGLPGVYGREAIEEWLIPFFGRYTYDLSIQHPRVRLAGEWAVECGTFLSALTDRTDGSTTRHGGTYMLLWYRDGPERWLIQQYIDVSDLLQIRWLS